jgi:hypothetical protein
LAARSRAGSGARSSDSTAGLSWMVAGTGSSRRTRASTTEANRSSRLLVAALRLRSPWAKLRW